MSVTLTQIAKRANVSVALVSRFVNGDPTLRVRKDKRERIVAACQALGADVSLAAVEESQHRRGLRNVVMPINHRHASDPDHWFADTSLDVATFQQAAKANGLRLTIHFFDPDHVEAEIRELMDSPDQCAGLLFQSGVLNASLAKDLIDRQIPHVTTSPLDEPFGVNTVTFHMIGGMREALDHLVQLGHERIGYMGGTNRYRYPRFLAAMAEKGLKLEERWYRRLAKRHPMQWQSQQWWELGCEATAQWLESGDSMPTALICSNDWLASAVAKTMRERGLVPGRDISIIGHGNIEQRRPNSLPQFEPGLTTFDEPRDLHARRCAERLVFQISGKQSGVTHEYVPTRMIIRASTGHAS